MSSAGAYKTTAAICDFTWWSSGNRCVPKAPVGIFTMNYFNFSRETPIIIL